MLRTLPSFALRQLQRRTVSSLRVVESTSSRSLALPLCFVSLKGFEPRDSPGWKDWIERFSAKGYTSLILDVDPEASIQSSTTSKELLDSLEKELLSLLRDPSTSSPFPPLLFASSISTLLAETYVSSHPLSGLVLHSPLPAPLAHSKFPQAFKTKLDEFDYEPFFPVAVVEGKGKGETQCRLVKEFVEEEDEEDGLVRRLVGDRDEAGWNKVMEWMDENGL